MAAERYTLPIEALMKAFASKRPQPRQSAGIPMGAGLMSPYPITPSPMEPGSFMPRGMALQPSTQGWTGGSPPPDMPAQGAAQAGPAPMQQRPMMPAPQAPMPPQRPVDLPIAQQGAEMMPGAMGQIQGFNPTAAMGNAQAYADQFSGGDLAKIAARTYRNDDGTSWNDYFVR